VDGNSGHDPDRERYIGPYQVKSMYIEFPEEAKELSDDALRIEFQREVTSTQSYEILRNEIVFRFMNPEKVEQLEKEMD